MPQNGWRLLGPMAFTLVELLATISVVVLLIALLLPSLGWATEQARRTLCAGNVRQWTMGLHSYALDHDGSFLPSRLRGTQPAVLNNYADIFVPFVSAYMPNSSVDCPNVAGLWKDQLQWYEQGILPIAEGKPYMTYSGYAYLGAAKDQAVSWGGVFGFDDYGYGLDPDAVPQSADAPSHWTLATEGAAQIVWRIGDADGLDPPNYWYRLTHPVSLGRGYILGWNTADYVRAELAGSNNGFVDGSVQWFDRSQLHPVLANVDWHYWWRGVLR